MSELDMSQWEPKREWWRHGRGFLVVVKHHIRPFEVDFDSEGPHRWNVYAFIYPSHPHFSKFDGPAMWQEAATCMPWHACPSLLSYPMTDGKVTAVKVGSDYHHLHDDHFTHYETVEDAEDVFSDAQAIYDWLAARAEAKEAA